MVYGIDGRRSLNEDDARPSRWIYGFAPVRIGNAAYQQLQLDIYGELMDSLYLYQQVWQAHLLRTLDLLRRLMNWVCDHWREKDDAIWEVRGGRRDFVYSKLMCWVARGSGHPAGDKALFPGGLARAG